MPIRVRALGLEMKISILFNSLYLLLLSFNNFIRNAHMQLCSCFMQSCVSEELWLAVVRLIPALYYVITQWGWLYV